MADNFNSKVGVVYKSEEELAAIRKVGMETIEHHAGIIETKLTTGFIIDTSGITYTFEQLEGVLLIASDISTQSLAVEAQLKKCLSRCCPVVKGSGVCGNSETELDS